MLYPLSYEGLRAISYLPADSPGCPVVPTVTNWCPPVQWERFHFWWRGAPSIFRPLRLRVLGGIGQAPSLPPRAHGSPSTRRPFATS